MGCFLHITEGDMAQISEALSAPSMVNVFQNFNQVFSGLDSLEKDELNQLLHDPEIARSKVVAAISNSVLHNRQETASSIVRDTCEVLRATGKPDGLLDRSINKSVYDRLASTKNEFNGARFELRVAADVIRGNAQLQKAGLFFSPGDKLSFGTKLPTNRTEHARPPGGGQTFFSFGARRSNVEADILIENKGMFSATQRIAIDPKWRATGPVGLDASRPSTLFQPGRQSRELQDQLRAVGVSIEQNRVDKFVLITNNRFTGPVHEYVDALNKDLAGKGQSDDSIVLIEHFKDS